MMRQCGATRPALRDAGWECTGSGLIVVFTTVQGPPVVLPARALDVVEPEDWWQLPVARFAGGDHFHLCLPRRPTTFRGDSVFMFGDVAMSFKDVGHVAGFGQIWTSAGVSGETERS